MRSLSILLIEDNEPVLRLIRSILEQSPNLQVVGQACDGLEAIEKAKEIQPDLILLDIGLPKMNGLEAAKRISKLAPMQDYFS